MTRQLPPTYSGDVDRWARELTEYLQNRDGVESEVIPKTAFLQHQRGDERAINDGLLMYDPVAGRIALSKDGIWCPIALDVAYIYDAQYNDLLLDLTWQPLVVANPPATQEPGTYNVAIQGLATATSGNAALQFRYTIDGTPVATGEERDLANGESIATRDVITLSTDYAGTVQLEATGSSVQLTDYTSKATRIGTDDT